MSLKSSRMLEGWIQTSNYKAITIPKAAQIRKGVSDGSHSEHLQHLRKVCVLCGIEGNITDLIDCAQCHILFVHSQCTLSRENENPDWTCELCTENQKMQLIHSPKKIRRTSRMKAGWVPNKILSYKSQNIVSHDNMDPKESGVQSQKNSDQDGVPNKVIKVQTQNSTSASFPRSGIHAVDHEPRRRRTLIMDYSDIFGSEESNVRSVAHKSTQGLFQQARDRHRLVGQRNDTKSDKNEGHRIELRKEQSIKGVRHAVNIKGDPRKLALDNVPAEPILNHEVWRGHVLVQFGSYRAEMELFAYLSTKSTSKVAETVRALPSILNLAVKCRSVVWPRRRLFHTSTLSDEAIAIYFLPKFEKDEQLYDDVLEQEMKHDLALMYEMPSTNHNLLIFPSSLLQGQSRRLQTESYMWGAFEEKGDE